MTGSAIIGKADKEPRKKVETRFSGALLPRKEIADTKIRGYKIFKNNNDFVTVEAVTVAEALEKSGIKEPFRVVRLGSDIGNILNEEALRGKNDNKSS